VDGVFTADPLQDRSAELIREITPTNFSKVELRLSGSHDGRDRRMVDKVRRMIAGRGSTLCEVLVISAEREGWITGTVGERFLRGNDYVCLRAMLLVVL
jgi:uridylate kinase